MPRHFLIAFRCAILIATITLRPISFASEKWTDTCATVNASYATLSNNQLTINNYNVKPIHDPTLSMQALEVIVQKSSTISIDNEQFTRINNITSIGLMSLVLQRPISSCNSSYYIRTLSPFIKKIQAGGNTKFTWNDVTFQKGSNNIQAKKINVAIDSTNQLIHLHLQFSGLSTPNSSAGSEILPRDGSLDLEMGPQTYPILLANQQHRSSSSNASYPLTINSLTLTNAIAALTASGTVSIDENSVMNYAKGNVRVTHMDQLISNASTLSPKIKMGLILTKFAGKKDGVDALKWQISLKNNILNVNNVPIPLW